MYILIKNYYEILIQMYNYLIALGYFKFPLIKRKLIYTMNNADRLIAVSESLKEKMCDLGIRENKIEVVPNGVDFNKFFIVDKMKVRKELNLPLDKKIIFSVGQSKTFISLVVI